MSGLIGLLHRHDERALHFLVTRRYRRVGRCDAIYYPPLPGWHNLADTRAGPLQLSIRSFGGGHVGRAIIAVLPWPEALMAGALAALVGVSRSYLGVHYPGDVLAGWLLANVAYLLGGWLLG